MGAARTNPYALRMQASRQKPNYKKGLNWKGSCGFHIEGKYAKKTNSHANRYQGQVSTYAESTQTKKSCICVYAQLCEVFVW